MGDVISVPLEQGGSILIEVPYGDTEVPFGKVGKAMSETATTLQDHLGQIRDIAEAFHDRLTESVSRPDVLTVKFVAQFTTNGSMLLAQVGAAATFELTMEWRRPPAERSAPLEEGSGRA